MFANLGDGTYFHSGLLAVRQSIAAGVNITYKILYNDAVAMTGGQQVGERPEGHSVAQIAQSMRGEGAVRIVVVTDEPDKYTGVRLVEGVAVHHRDELDAVQRQFREIKGTTVIIYDQSGAAANAAAWSTPPNAWSSTNWSAKAAAIAACSPIA
jgi:indolepyruvate ferredoxin oxidoreductase